MVWYILKSLGVSALLWFASLNTIGFLLNGLFVVDPNQFGPSTARVREVIAEHSAQASARQLWLGLFLLAAYVGALYWIHQPLLGVAALLLMIQRVPDVLAALQDGAKSQPSKVVQWLSLAMMVLAFGSVFWAYYPRSVR